MITYPLSFNTDLTKFQVSLGMRMSSLYIAFNDNTNNHVDIPAGIPISNAFC